MKALETTILFYIFKYVLYLANMFSCLISVWNNTNNTIMDVFASNALFISFGTYQNHMKLSKKEKIILMQEKFIWIEVLPFYHELLR